MRAQFVKIISDEHTSTNAAANDIHELPADTSDAKCVRVASAVCGCSTSSGLPSIPFSAFFHSSLSRSSISALGDSALVPVWRCHSSSQLTTEKHCSSAPSAGRTRCFLVNISRLSSANFCCFLLYTYLAE